MPNLPKSENPNIVRIELDLLEQSKDIINQIENLSNDSEKINSIVSYIEKSNDLLLQYGIVINFLLANQEKTLETLNINLDSISKINDRVNGNEKHLEIHDTHIETHDKHLDALGTHLANHDKYLDVHDRHLELLSQESIH